MDEHRLLRNKVSTMIDTAKKEAYQTKLRKEKMTPGLFGNYLSNLERTKKDLQKLIILK